MHSAAAPATDIDDLWQDYWANPVHGSTTEDLIVRAHVQLAKQVADRMYSNLPNNVDYQEVHQNALIGLLDAVRNWRPELAAFRTYAGIKMRSRILDGLRAADWLSRDTRRAVRTVQNGIVELERSLNRTPSDEEVAAHLNMTVADVQTALLNHSTAHVGSLDELFPNRGGSEGSDTSLGARLAEESDLSAHEIVEREQDAAQLRHALDALPERERQIMALYYYENLTLANIGEILGVTESRICQLRAKALIVLRTRLTGELPPLDDTEPDLALF